MRFCAQSTKNKQQEVEKTSIACTKNIENFEGEKSRFQVCNYHVLYMLIYLITASNIVILSLL